MNGLGFLQTLHLCFCISMSIKIVSTDSEVVRLDSRIANNAVTAQGVQLSLSSIFDNL